MSNAMVIDFQSTGITRAVSGMNQLLTGLKQFQAAQKALGTGSGGGGLVPSGGGGAGGGPFARLAKAQAALQLALRSGSGIPDAQYRVLQAHQAAQRAQQALNGGPGFNSRLMSFVGSMRYGAGGFMPLVGQTLKLFGLSGPIGLAVTATAAALVGFGAAVKQAAETLTELRSAALQTGAGAGDVAGLRGMGLSPEQIQSVAMSLRGTLAQGGMGAVYGSRAGLSGADLVGPQFGNANSAQVLQKTLSYLGSITSEEERYRAALALHLTSLLPLVDLYQRHSDTMKADAAALSAVNNDAATRQASDFMYQLGRVGEMFQLLLTAVVKPFLPFLTLLAEGLADVLQVLARVVDFIGPFAVAVAAIPKAFEKLAPALEPLKRALEPLLAAFRKIDGAITGTVRNAFARLADALNRLVTGRLLDLVVLGVNLLVPALAALVDAIPKVYDSFVAFLNGITSKLPGGDALKLPKWADLKDPMDDLKRSLDNNTDATRANTDKMPGVFAPGTYGGGNSVRGAFPSKWTQFEAATATSIWRGQRLGHFALG